MEANEVIQNMAARTSANGNNSVQASIDKLAEAFTQFRVESAKDTGGTSEQLRHIQEDIKELSGLFEKVAAHDTRITVLETEKREADKMAREWRDESIADRGKIKASIEKLEETTDGLRGQLMFYAGAIAVLSIVAQVVLKLVFHV